MGFPRQEYWSGLPFPPPGDSLGSVIHYGSIENEYHIDLKRPWPAVA